MGFNGAGAAAGAGSGAMAGTSIYPGWGTAIGAVAGGLIGGFTGGGEEAQNKQLSTFDRRQIPVYNQLTLAARQPGAGGAFGNAADYYYDLLNNDSQTANMMFEPEMRRYREQIIPDLAEQFAGMGAGNLSSSGFRNASVSAGTDLSERLGAIRAGLRERGAAGLAGIGKQALNPSVENIHVPGVQGSGPAFAELAGTLAGNKFSQPNQTPQTNAPAPQGQPTSGNYNLPNFMENTSSKGTSSPYGSSKLPDFQYR